MLVLSEVHLSAGGKNAMQDQMNRQLDQVVGAKNCSLWFPDEEENHFPPPSPHSSVLRFVATCYK